MISTIHSAAIQGIDAARITIEVSVGRGIGYYITGLPDDAIKESITRIGIAIESCGFKMPRTKIVVNLFPAGIKKYGTAFDLPIALAILAASGQVNTLNKLENYIVTGELGLDAKVLEVNGPLIIADFAKACCDGVVLPQVNANEAALIKNLPIYGIGHLLQLIQWINGEVEIPPTHHQTTPTKIIIPPSLDFKDVKGQDNIKRALEIAAAGNHNIIMTGPPGSSKTTLASRLPSILTPLTIEEAIETTKIHSLANLNNNDNLIVQRPFRAPHHTISDIGLAGGGLNIHPGEISLAHNGILFLDEFPLFKKSAVEILRQPLENKKIIINRSKQSIELPASFMLVAAMNPCECGFFGTNKCTCSQKSISAYQNKISAPILERIDLYVFTELLHHEGLLNTQQIPEPSAAIRNRVIAARIIQAKRFQHYPEIKSNSDMFPLLIEQFCEPEIHAKRFLARSMEKHPLSARSYHHILKIARTIADLAGHEQIELGDMAEAIFFRSPSRSLDDKSLRRHQWARPTINKH